MRVEVRFYFWDGRIRGLGEWPSLKEVTRRFRLIALERNRHPDLLADLGAERAYTQPCLDGVWVAFPRRWEPQLRPPREPLPWERTGEVGEMRSHWRGEYVECHVCGEWFRSVGHHARWRHGLSPEEYRERFGLNRQTPLCSLAYTQACRRRNWRLGLHRNVRPHRFTSRPEVPSHPCRLEARRNIGEAMQESHVMRKHFQPAYGTPRRASSTKP